MITHNYKLWIKCADTLKDSFDKKRLTVMEFSLETLYYKLCRSQIHNRYDYI